MADEPIRVTVWGEGRHEKRDVNVASHYPDGMHATIASGITEYAGAAVAVRCVTLDDPDQGLPASLLASTDVLTWWGHIAHDEVSDDLVDRVQEAVLAGMGLVVLHSGHWSKIFKRLMGTSCALRWRNGDDRELVWTVDPAHPVAAGVPSPIEIPSQEMYGEFFDIPAPDELVFVSSFTGGEVFRSGCAWRRGRGRIFYFSPGDQDYPVYHHPDVRRVLANAAVWAAPAGPRSTTPIAYAAPDWFVTP
ncbi:trehalose utilization protein ThuA [Asanoa ishikariensis]|uniref:Trehalose utilization protein n=1 Tax=Asanoa ishikariensis TaxID=137265 RepID=A0A1H3MX70_9ACTN|nr:ThuA domain-containing protein [Asanoa ishikariensis]GIF68985.1 trehalose utilization protein ThuA [Asanoa ishikariensis]SDY81307.1 Trehalose utilization protein [Asanoa ishikariensis]